jgi:hypothetical protein
MAIAAAARHVSLGDVIDRWDSRWFLRAAVNGYPRHLPMVDGHVAGNTLAFFPGLPLLMRGLSDATGMSLFAAGTTISTVTGLTAMIAVWALVKEYAGPAVATTSTLLLAFFPGSFVFSLIYSEGIAITCIALGLLALMRRKWVLAGVLGLVATATAPITIAFEISCLWAAGAAIRSRRDWRALAAPILTPLGFVAYIGWTWWYTGTASAWSLTEKGGWKSYLSIAYPFHLVASFVSHPLSSNATTNLLFAGIIFVGVTVAIALRDRLPAPVLLYAITVGVAVLIAAPIGPRPRFILDAFPLVLVLGAHLRGRKLWAVLSVFGVLLAAMAFYAAYSYAVFP